MLKNLGTVFLRRLRNLEREDDMITWKCHICDEERPDSKISVHTSDASSKYGLPPGTMKMNVRFCNDKPDCIKKAPNFNLLNK